MQKAVTTCQCGNAGCINCKPNLSLTRTAAGTEEKLTHIEKCLDWSTAEKYNDAIVALGYIEEIRREKAFWKLGKVKIISEVSNEA